MKTRRLVCLELISRELAREKLRNDGLQDAFPIPAEGVGGECTAIV